jgi:2',3'-cyclic-nucleotide 2'-phosphodiesterase (5'-nucleotidase family)
MLTRFDPNGKPEEDLPFLSANVTLFGSPELGVPQRYRVYEVNGIKIGVTSIVSPKLTVDNPYLNGDLTVAEPMESLAPVVESLMSESPDLLVLLSHADTEETRALIQKFPQFHLVVSAGWL